MLCVNAPRKPMARIHLLVSLVLVIICTVLAFTPLMKVVVSQDTQDSIKDLVEYIMKQDKSEDAAARNEKVQKILDSMDLENASVDISIAAMSKLSKPLTDASNAITEMMTVKKLFFKTGGREQIHLVVSLTPDDRNRSDNVYLELASKVAGIFEGFQSYFAVHKDTAIRHMHIVLNSVSIDGHKFSQSKSDLHRLKQKCNDLLGQFGFDPISIRPENLLDSTDYSQ